MNEKINLFIKYQSVPAEMVPEESEWMTGADAVIIDPCQCDISRFYQMPVDNAIIYSGDPERDSSWCENNLNQWVRDDGLEEVARFRDRWQELNWVPHLTVYRTQISYRFSGPALGEGFSFYMPDTSTIKGWRVTDGDMLLTEAINKAAALGFSSLWLHSVEAESKAKGLDLEMLDRTRDEPLDIWISGGASDRNHLHNLMKVGGVSAVVVSEKLARKITLESLNNALKPLDTAHEETTDQYVQFQSQVSEM